MNKPVNTGLDQGQSSESGAGPLLCWFVEAMDWRTMQMAGWWTGDEWTPLSTDPTKAKRFERREAEAMASVMHEERVMTFYAWKATEHMFCSAPAAASAPKIQDAGKVAPQQPSVPSEPAGALTDRQRVVAWAAARNLLDPRYVDVGVPATVEEMLETIVWCAALDALKSKATAPAVNDSERLPWRAADGQDLRRALVDLVRAYGVKPSVAGSLVNELDDNGWALFEKASAPATSPGTTEAAQDHVKVADEQQQSSVSAAGALVPCSGRSENGAHCTLSAGHTFACWSINGPFIPVAFITREPVSAPAQHERSDAAGSATFPDLYSVQPAGYGEDAIDLMGVPVGVVADERDALLRRAHLMLSCWSVDEQGESGRLSLVRDMAAYLSERGARP